MVTHGYCGCKTIRMVISYKTEARPITSISLTSAMFQTSLYKDKNFAVTRSNNFVELLVLSVSDFG